MIDFFNVYVLITIIVVLLIILFGKYNVIARYKKENDELYIAKYSFKNISDDLKNCEDSRYVLEVKNKALVEQINNLESFKKEYIKLNQVNANNENCIKHLMNKQYFAQYNTNVFSNINIRNTYVIVMNSNIFNTQDVNYIVFVNILLYVDSLHVYNMYINELYLDDKCHVNVYQLDQFVFELTKHIKEIAHNNTEIFIIAGILSLFGFSQELELIKKPKIRGYKFSKIIANELLYFQEEKYLNDIMKCMNYLTNDFKNNDMNTIIKVTASSLESETWILEELEKSVVCHVNFKPKSVCNTMISIVEK